MTDDETAGAAPSSGYGEPDERGDEHPGTPWSTPEPTTSTVASTTRTKWGRPSW